MYNLIVILGPTASGKTALAVDLAKYYNTGVISADSRQVYKYMDVGTGKDLSEYENVPYHLINILEPGEKYNVASFQNDFNLIFNTYTSENKIPILCGGTGLYINAVLNNYSQTQIKIDSFLRNELENLTHDELISKLKKINSLENIDYSTKKRTIRAIEKNIFSEQKNIIHEVIVPLKPFVIGLNPERETRRANIENRLQYRLKNGLIEEVENLLHMGISHEMLNYYGLEYKFVSDYLLKKFTLLELETKLCVAIQQYAKRQMTYFRNMEKNGITINWINF
ncbi:MAG: tRNA (adenosine(37)-N6)-dimethylallyltransferase MiaA [Cytophagales bacterium]